MKALLTALQEGRLVELPDNIKNDALEFLGTLLEAIPEIADEGGITEKAFARENIHNTGIGRGWACPHATSDHGFADGFPKSDQAERMRDTCLLKTSRNVCGSSAFGPIRGLLAGSEIPKTARPPTFWKAM